MMNLFDMKSFDISITQGSLVSLVLILIVFVPMLLCVAFMTIIERKAMGSMQRRIGPNVVGYYGVLQPFADALKLVVKEQIIPAQSNKALFFLAPMISLVFSLLGWAANSKYAFLGSLRSTAQMVSYELIFSTCVFTVILMTGSLNFTTIVESQTAIWFIVPLFPIFIMYLISALAELNRTPFDLPEAESELVSGFMTEHSGMIFVFFYLAEYSGVVFMSTFSTILFLGGYGFPEIITNNTFINLQSIILALKALLFMFFFVWVRATFVRQRYDRLMIFCWTQLLPMSIALLILVPSLLIAFDIPAVNL